MADIPFVAGETALVVTIPESEPVVGRWRERFDSFAACGVPAHVTVLYPFLPAGRIDARLRGQRTGGLLGAVAARRLAGCTPTTPTPGPGMLRVAGSLVTNYAYDLLRMFGREGRPTPLGQACHCKAWREPVLHSVSRRPAPGLHVVHAGRRAGPITRHAQLTPS